MLAERMTPPEMVIRILKIPLDMLITKVKTAKTILIPNQISVALMLLSFAVSGLMKRCADRHVTIPRIIPAMIKWMNMNAHKILPIIQLRPKMLVKTEGVCIPR